jgi:restriction system protein
LEFQRPAPDGAPLSGAEPAEPDPSLSPEEVMGQAYEQIEAELGEQLLERTGQNTPAFFEKLVVRLLAAMGMATQIR